MTLAASFIALFFITTYMSIFTELPDWICAVLSLPVAVVVGWFAWKSASGKNPGIVFSVLCGALIVGGVGFAIGFWGPMILEPGANQGPMLGIFITGPLGSIAGAIGGLVYWLKQTRDTTD